MADDRVVAAHDQAFTHRYIVKYPAHDPRAHDPHMHDFLEWKKRRRENGTYVCDFATEHRGGDTSECDNGHPLEAHHKVVELAMLNEIDLALLEKDFPGISAQSVGAWIDSDANLTLLCVAHHRGPGGVHTASFSDFGSEYFVRDLISKPDPKLWRVSSGRLKRPRRALPKRAGSAPGAGPTTRRKCANAAARRPVFRWPTALFRHRRFG